MILPFCGYIASGSNRTMLLEQSQCRLLMLLRTKGRDVELEVLEPDEHLVEPYDLLTAP